MTFSTLRYELEDNVLLLTLDRPEKLNAFNGTMQREMIAALQRADRDDEVRAIIVTGAGRGFCAGADLGSRGDTFRYQDDVDRHRDGGGLLSLEIFKLTTPLIAAVNGPAVGVGITMTLPMDVRIASSAARMGFVFVRRGMVPEACSTFFLPRLVGMSRATEWMLTGRVFDAREALAGGLISRLVAPDELLPTARAVAREIAEHAAPVSVALTRQMLWRTFAYSHPMEAHRIESKGIYTRGMSDDAKEGVESFLDKRTPRFPQRPSRDLPAYYPWWEEPEF